jgi:hypothetical protein
MERLCTALGVSMTAGPGTPLLPYSRDDMAVRMRASCAARWRSCFLSSAMIRRRSGILLFKKPTTCGAACVIAARGRVRSTLVSFERVLIQRDSAPHREHDSSAEDDDEFKAFHRSVLYRLYSTQAVFSSPSARPTGIRRTPAVWRQQFFGIVSLSARRGPAAENAAI